MNSVRRILMVAPTSFFLDYGCHIRILEECRALQACGLHVRIATYYLGRDLPGLDIVRSRPTPWRPDYEVGSSRHKIAFDMLLSWRVLEQAVRWRPDLIHGHLHEGALIGSTIGHPLGLPVVFDFQGSLTGEMLDHGFLKPGTMAFHWWRRLEERIVEMPEAILTSTTHAATLLSEDFGRTHGVTPLPDSVDLDFFDPARYTPEEKSAVRAKLGVPDGRRVIVYLGLLADYQGIPQLLQAVARLRERSFPVSCLLMGFPGVEQYRRQAHELGLAPEDVIFTGKVPWENAPRYLALGDIAVAPKLSATEGSGKILNYMAMGLPVVTYDTPVSREYLGPLGRYASPLGEASALADAMASLLDDPATARQLGQALRDRAQAHFSWKRTGAQILEVYQSLREA